MALYAIGDLHLSLGSDKPMDVFGGRWSGYVDKLREGFAGLTEKDTTVLCGDLSWGMSLAEAREDFLFIDRLPGRKIVLKGNHDYWWSTASAAYKFFAANGISTIEILNNNCLFYGETALCGTRGWFYEEERGSEHDRKIMLRELGRLEASLKAAGERGEDSLPALPAQVRGLRVPRDTRDARPLRREGVLLRPHPRKGLLRRLPRVKNGVKYELVSADQLMFRPLRVRD